MGAHACKCVGPPSYDAIFEGRVEHISSEAAQPSRLTKVELAVTRAGTEAVTQTVTVHTPAPVLMCGVPFKVGHTYLVRAMRVQEHLETLDCYGTKER
jgi:hypothetical protein